MHFSGMYNLQDNLICLMRDQIFLLQSVHEVKMWDVDHVKQNHTQLMYISITLNLCTFQSELNRCLDSLIIDDT